MSKKKILGMVAVVVVAILIFLVVRSCQLHTDSLYGLKVVGDGTGGAIAVYEDIKHDIYSQKISPDGKALWGEKGVLLGSSHRQFYRFSSFQIESDSAGGTIIAWWEITSSQRPPITSVCHISKLDSGGRTVWQRDFERVDQLIDDGAGGAIVDYSPDGKTLFVVRIDSNGNFPWGENGISISQRGTMRQIASDGSGGAFIVWQELQHPPEAKPDEAFSTGRIYAQKIDSNGNLSWGEEDVLLYTTPEGVYAEALHITSDGQGGAIAVWNQMSNRRIESGSPEALLMDLYVQKIDASGNIFWRLNGLPLEINKAAEGAFPIESRLVSDNSGGAIIIWRDFRDRASIYAQKIDANGSISWQPGGVNVSSTALNPFHSIASDGSGGAIVSYYSSGDRKGLHVQKLGSDGRVVWQDNGVPIVDGDCASHYISSDGQCGALVAWGIGKGMFNSEKAYIQRVSAEGKLLWGEKGIKLDG